MADDGSDTTTGPTAYRIAGIVEAAAAVPLGALWLLSGIGVGFCSDGHDAAYCNGLSRVWVAFGVSAAACFISGLAMVAVARRPRTSGAIAAAIAAYGTSAMSAIGFGAWLLAY